MDGQFTQGFLYQDALRPAAELNNQGQVRSRFVYATGRTTPDLMIRGGVTYRILTDHLGSPRLVVNASTGEVAQRLDYDPHGRITQDTNPGFQPFAFAGGLHDPDTGLLRFGARDYDPETGRWTTKDPIGFAGGDTNLCAYTLGDPVNFVDPDGLSILDDIAGTVSEIPNTIASGDFSRFLAAEGVGAFDALSFGRYSDWIGVDPACLGTGYYIGGALTAIPATAGGAGAIGMWAARNTSVGARLFAASPRGLLNMGKLRIGVSKYRGTEYFSLRYRNAHFDMWPPRRP